MIQKPAYAGPDTRKQQHLNTIMREVVVLCFVPIVSHANHPLAKTLLVFPLGHLNIGTNIQWLYNRHHLHLIRFD